MTNENLGGAGRVPPNTDRRDFLQKLVAAAWVFTLPSCGGALTEAELGPQEPEATSSGPLPAYEQLLNACEDAPSGTGKIASLIAFAAELTEDQADSERNNQQDEVTAASVNYALGRTAEIIAGWAHENGNTTLEAGCLTAALEHYVAFGKVVIRRSDLHGELGDERINDVNVRCKRLAQYAAESPPSAVELLTQAVTTAWEGRSERLKMLRGFDPETEALRYAQQQERETAEPRDYLIALAEFFRQFYRAEDSTHPLSSGNSQSVFLQAVLAHIDPEKLDDGLREYLQETQALIGPEGEEARLGILDRAAENTAQQLVLNSVWLAPIENVRVGLERKMVGRDWREINKKELRSLGSEVGGAKIEPITSVPSGRWNKDGWKTEGLTVPQNAVGIVGVSLYFDRNNPADVRLGVEYSTGAGETRVKIQGQSSRLINRGLNPSLPAQLTTLGTENWVRIEVDQENSGAYIVPFMVPIRYQLDQVCLGNHVWLGDQAPGPVPPESMADFRTNLADGQAHEREIGYAYVRPPIQVTDSGNRFIAGEISPPVLLSALTYPGPDPFWRGPLGLVKLDLAAACTEIDPRPATEKGCLAPGGWFPIIDRQSVLEPRSFRVQQGRYRVGSAATDTALPPEWMMKILARTPELIPHMGPKQTTYLMIEKEPTDVYTAKNSWQRWAEEYGSAAALVGASLAFPAGVHHLAPWLAGAYIAVEKTLPIEAAVAFAATLADRVRARQALTEMNQTPDGRNP